MIEEALRIIAGLIMVVAVWLGPVTIWVVLLYRRHWPKAPPFQSLLGAVVGGPFLSFMLFTLFWTCLCIGAPTC